MNLYHVPTSMSCHKAVMVIIGRADCFHDCIYSMLILRVLSTLCGGSLMTTYISIMGRRVYKTILLFT